MRKSLFYFVLASCFLVACKDKGNVNLNQPISWMDGYYIRFNPIVLRSDTSQYYPKYGPYNGPAYLSYSHPITDFWTVFDLPAASLPAGEKVTSAIIATTNVNGNPKFPSDSLSNPKIFDNYNPNLSVSQRYPNGLKHNEMGVWRAFNRDFSWQHLTVEIWSGPYCRMYDMKEGTVYWTWTQDAANYLWAGNVEGMVVNGGTFQVHGVFKPIQEKPFIDKIYKAGAMVNCQIEMPNLSQLAVAMK